MASINRTLTFITASIAPAASSSTNQTIVGNACDIVKINVTPSVVTAGELTSVFIYKHNTFSAGDICYSTTSFSGSLVDPIETDGITSTERNEGFVAKYEDADNANQLHIKITNSGTVSKTFAVTIEYQTIGFRSGTTGTIATGATVAHGLGGTPAQVLVTATQSGPTDIYVTAKGATTFTINFGGGGGKTFDWIAIP